MDSNFDIVPSSAIESREAVVDHQEASEPRVSASASRIPGRRLNWTEIFRNRPDLSPPGYEQAMDTANEKTRLKKEAALQVAAEKAKAGRGRKKR